MTSWNALDVDTDVDTELQTSDKTAERAEETAPALAVARVSKQRALVEPGASAEFKPRHGGAVGHCRRTFRPSPRIWMDLRMDLRSQL
jgi:hypothetical protein